MYNTYYTVQETNMVLPKKSMRVIIQKYDNYLYENIDVCLAGQIFRNHFYEIISNKKSYDDVSNFLVLNYYEKSTNDLGTEFDRCRFLEDLEKSENYSDYDDIEIVIIGMIYSERILDVLCEKATKINLICIESRWLEKIERVKGMKKNNINIFFSPVQLNSLSSYSWSLCNPHLTLPWEVKAVNQGVIYEGIYEPDLRIFKELDEQHVIVRNTQEYSHLYNDLYMFLKYVFLDLHIKEVKKSEEDCLTNLADEEQFFTAIEKMEKEQFLEAITIGKTIKSKVEKMVKEKIGEWWCDQKFMNIRGEKIPTIIIEEWQRDKNFISFGDGEVPMITVGTLENEIIYKDILNRFMLENESDMVAVIRATRNEIVYLGSINPDNDCGELASSLGGFGTPRYGKFSTRNLWLEFYD